MNRLTWFFEDGASYSYEDNYNEIDTGTYYGDSTVFIDAWAEAEDALSILEREHGEANVLVVERADVYKVQY